MLNVGLRVVHGVSVVRRTTHTSPWRSDARAGLRKDSALWRSCRPISRVVLRVLVDQSRGFDRRVDLGGADAGVTEHLLDRAEVRAATEKMRGKGMTQQVRLHRLFQS